MTPPTTERIPLSEIRWWARWIGEHLDDCPRKQAVAMAVAYAQAERIDGKNGRVLL